MLRKISAVARLEILGGLRRYAILGLVLLAFALEVGGLLFMDFIPRDIGRASADFILTIGWFTGLLFLLFHCVHVFAWNDERRTIHTLLARPIRRREYVLGVYLGLAALLFLLNAILALVGFGVLHLIQNTLHQMYFAQLTVPHYVLAWLGLFCIELMLLAVIAMFSGLVRGAFPVLLLAISYYLICSGLPVVRGAFADSDINAVFPLDTVLTALTVLFPDFGRFDFKEIITEPFAIAGLKLGLNFGLFACFLIIVLGIACVIYQQRDLQ